MFILPRTNSPVIKLINDQPVFYWWTLFRLAVGLGFSVLLAVAGIGLLKLKPSGRTMSVGYSIASLALGVIGIVFNWIFLVGPLAAEAGKSSGPHAVGATAGAISGMVGGLCPMVYPILLLIFMTRPKLVAAFNPSAPPPVPPPVA